MQDRTSTTLDFLSIDPSDLDSATLSIIAIGKAVGDLGRLPADQDIRAFFLERLQLAVQQYGEFVSEDERDEMDQFYEAIADSIGAHREAFPEMHNPIWKTGVEP